MKNKIVFVLIFFICHGSLCANAQNIEFHNSERDEFVTNEIIYSLLKIKGVDQLDNTSESVVFYHQQLDGFVFVTCVNNGNTLPYLTIVSPCTYRHSGQLMWYDFRYLGDVAPFMVANYAMKSSRKVKVLYEEQDGQVNFWIDIPLLRTSEFATQFEQCLKDIKGAKKAFMDMVQILTPDFTDVN